MSTNSAADTNANTTSATPALVARSRARVTPEGDGIHLSEAAAAEIKQIIAKDNMPDTMYLFVGVKGGGCSGFQYVLDLRDEAQQPIGEQDEVFDSRGVTVVCEFKSYVVGALAGTIIDYHSSIMGAGFTFNNPNAKHTCGCGSSYSA